jgi:hypothetical protein
MPLKLLQETVRMRLLKKGAAPEAVEKYFSRWEVALDTDNAPPLPCPDCYLVGEVSLLRRVPSPAGVGVVECPACAASFEFPDFQPVASTQGIWPTQP